VPTDTLSHQQAKTATAPDFWLTPQRKPFHPHGLKAQRLYGLIGKMSNPFGGVGQAAVLVPGGAGGEGLRQEPQQNCYQSLILAQTCPKPPNLSNLRYWTRWTSLAVAARLRHRPASQPGEIRHRRIAPPLRQIMAPPRCGEGFYSLARDMRVLTQLLNSLTSKGRSHAWRRNR